LPQNGAPRSEGRMVFFVPQFGHARTEVGPVGTGRAPALAVSRPVAEEFGLDAPAGAGGCCCSDMPTAYRDPRESLGFVL
jgi:hypothetical protein